MSTTFGILKRGHVRKEDIDEDDYIEVAFRSNGIRFTHELAEFLPDDTSVTPLDNSAQGIYTIGDIKKQMNDKDRDNKRST
jgi:hypothetical protein